MKRFAVSMLAAGMAVCSISTTALAVTAADVGDADSFGRAVKYLGLAQTGVVSAQTDCTPDPSAPLGPNDRCILLPAQPATTTINESNLGVINLPAKATRSLLCFALTPITNFQFNNLTGVAQSSARYGVNAVFTVSSTVLNDPALIDPTTGLPFGGKLTLALSTYSENRSLAVGERDQKALRLSRDCIGGLVSKQSLIDSYGLTAAQATSFFANPISISLGMSGTLRLVDFASMLYGVRFYGDP